MGHDYEEHSCVRWFWSVNSRALDGFSVYTRPHVHFSMHITCLAFHRSWCNQYWCFFLLKGGKCVFCGIVGSFYIIHVPLLWFLICFSSVPLNCVPTGVLVPWEPHLLIFSIFQTFSLRYVSRTSMFFQDLFLFEAPFLRMDLRFSWFLKMDVILIVGGISVYIRIHHVVCTFNTDL